MKIERKSLMATAKYRVEIVEEELDPDDAMTENSIAGKTLFSLVSAGTEINGYYENVFDWPYPIAMGYSAVFRIKRMGEAVQGFEIGDLVFCSGTHSSYQIADYREAVKVLENVPAREALFARMAGISMATLQFTQIKPPEIVMVMGLGCVGLLAAQCYQQCGYHVIAVEPDPARRETARQNGIVYVFEKAPIDNPAYAGRVGLVLECSGFESAVLDGLNIARKGGEISVIGVPWKKNTELSAHEILNKIFYNFIKVYSGWEHQVPLREYEPHPVLKADYYNGISGVTNYKKAMELLNEKRLSLKGQYEIRPFEDGQAIYDDIYNKVSKAVSTVISWE